jgi:hypothetical protein
MKGFDVMENTNVSESTTQNNKAPFIGFILMLAGPAILILAGLVTGAFGYLPRTAANIVSYVTMFLPGIGAVVCIVTLFRWKKTGKLGRSLAVVTVVMCNPFFYFFYFFICAISSSTLAGLSWM